MRVLIANPPWRKPGRLGVRAGSRWPFTLPGKKLDYIPFPFFLAYAAAILEGDGAEVMFVDAIAEGIDEAAFLARAAEFAPALAVIETSTPSIDSDLATAAGLRERTGARIVACGPHATVFGREFLAGAECVDFLMSGEYEYTLRDLARALGEGGGALGSVRGLIYRSGAGIVTNEPRPLIADLDELPWPSRRRLPMLNYRDAFSGIPQPGLQVWSSRGCPFGCIFCMWPQIIYRSKKYRMRSPRDVIDEVEWCLERWPLKSVYFDDDTFNISKSHVLGICEEIGRRGLSIPWGAMARADTADYEMLRAMADAGLYAIKYGIESGDQRIVDNCRKDLDLKKAVSVVKMTKRLGIKTHITFTIGLPGETRGAVMKSLRLAKRLSPEGTQFSITVPFPGTAYYHMVREQGRLKASSWSEYDGAGFAVLDTENLTASELQGLYKLARDEWEKFYYRREVLRRLRRETLSFIMKLLRHPFRSLGGVFRFVFWKARPD